MADGKEIATVGTRSAPTIPFSELERMARSFAQSNLFGAKSESQALALLMIGQAEDMHPALAMQEFDIIENKPCRKAERIAARFQLSGGKIEWIELTDTIAKAKFSHPQGSEVTLDWTIERARAITYRTKEGKKSLADKDNWKNYTRAMLRSRVVAEGCRTSFPAYAIVTLSTEEALDYGTLDSQVIANEDTGADEPISAEQLDLLRQGIEETGTDIERFCRYMGIEAIPDLRQRDFIRAVDAIDAKRKANAAETSK